MSDTTMKPAEALRALEEQARLLRELAAKTLETARQRVLQACDVDDPPTRFRVAVLFGALADNARALVEQYGGHAPAPLDVTGELRSIARGVTDDIEAAIAEPVSVDPDLYADEIAVLKEQR